MMRAVCFLAGLVVATPSLADQPLGGSTRSFGETFNQKSKAIGFDARIAFAKCESGQAKVCNYSGGSDMQILSASVGTGDKLNFVVITFGGKQADAAKLLESLTVMMALYAPNASVDEAKVTIRSLIDSIKGDSSQDAVLHGIKFNATKVSGIIMIGVTRL